MSTLVREVASDTVSLSAAGSTGSAAISLPGGSVAVTNNKIVALFAFDGVRTYVSATDAAGSTYNSRGSFNDTTNTTRYQLLEATVAASNAGQSFSFILSGNSGNNATVYLAEVSGLNASQTAAELVGAMFASGTAFDSGALGTPSTSTDFLIGMAGHGNRSWTLDPGYTDKSSGFGAGSHAGIAVNSTGEDRYLLTADVSTSCGIVCARLVGTVAGGGTVSKFMLLGVG